MKTKKNKAYGYENLGSVAKNRAIENQRKLVMKNRSWADSIINDFEDICKIFNFRVDKVLFSPPFTSSHRVVVEGKWISKLFKLDHIKIYTPHDSNIEDVARYFLDLANHYPTLSFTTEHDSYASLHEDNIIYNPENAGKPISETARRKMILSSHSLMHYIYSKLYNELDWLTSTEVVIEEILENESMFDVDGNILK